RDAAARRRAGRRRLGVLLVAVVGIAVLAWAVAGSHVRDAVDEIRLPLKHDDIIRQQAREKDLDPALIAAVIYAESRFRDNQESGAGAMGLMQVTPDTARDIARQSGANTFAIGDLHTADVNIRYGTWRLRDMLERFDGDTTLAVAAYNAGPENAKRWQSEAAAAGHAVRVRDITFPETRNYVQKVLDARRDYRRTYPRELGLG
ncbi:lytic transglycosylase domain-containing protein, partial [Patulibacter sp. S7RM1-6]